MDHTPLDVIYFWGLTVRTCGVGSSSGRTPLRGAKISLAVGPHPPSRRPTRRRASSGRVASCREDCHATQEIGTFASELLNKSFPASGSPASEKFFSTLRSRRNSLASPRKRLSHAASKMFTAPNFLGIILTLCNSNGATHF